MLGVSSFFRCLLDLDSWFGYRHWHNDICKLNSILTLDQYIFYICLFSCFYPYIWVGYLVIPIYLLLLIKKIIILTIEVHVGQKFWTFNQKLLLLSYRLKGTDIRTNTRRKDNNTNIILIITDKRNWSLLVPLYKSNSHNPSLHTCEANKLQHYGRYLCHERLRYDSAIILNFFFNF